MAQLISESVGISIVVCVHLFCMPNIFTEPNKSIPASYKPPWDLAG